MNNFYIIFVAGLIPLIVGFIWYNNAVFGKAWMRTSGVTEERMKSSNMAVIFGLTYLLSVMLSLFLFSVVVHQSHVGSIFVGVDGFGVEGSEVNNYFNDFMAKYGQRYRTFKHGMFHGVLASLFVAMPIVGVITLFERRGFKYFAIHMGFWIISIMLMGGVVCEFM